MIFNIFFYISSFSQNWPTYNLQGLHSVHTLLQGLLSIYMHPFARAFFSTPFGKGSLKIPFCKGLPFYKGYKTLLQGFFVDAYPFPRAQRSKGQGNLFTSTCLICKASSLPILSFCKDFMTSSQIYSCCELQVAGTSTIKILLAPCPSSKHPVR